MSLTKDDLHGWLELIRAEYAEAPDLKLTQAQAEQFWGLDGPTIETLLKELLSIGVLKVTRDGAYVRALSEG